MRKHNTGMALAILLLARLVCAQASVPPSALLNSARTAFNDRNYAFAVDRFREYLKTAPKGADLASAQYGLGMSLLAGPRDLESAQAALTAAVNTPDFPERPYALYYLATSTRQLAQDLSQQAAGKPITEIAKILQQANAKLAQAAAYFAVAADAFGPAKADFFARARCDQAEVLLRLGQYTKAHEAIEPIATSDAFKNNPLRSLALYYHGYASFGLKDYVAAGKSLAQLAPFEENGFGIHARFLLARTHHLTGERGEASAQYEGLVSEWLRHRQLLQDALKRPDLKPEDRARLAAQIAEAPDFVARAMYYGGMLHMEATRYEEALNKFLACVQYFPKSVAAAECQLQAGICQVLLRRFPEATASLQALAEHPRLADQALRWLAKAQVGATEGSKASGGLIVDVPTPQPVRMTALGAGIESLKKALERVQTLTGDADAKARRDTMLLELGDMQRDADQHKDAAASYALAAASLNPAVAEVAKVRQIIALQLAEDYVASDAAILQFQQAYPKSAMLPEMATRYAENALLAANSAAAPTRAQRNYAHAIDRFQSVITKYPDTEYAVLARLGLATVQYQLDQYGEALKSLAAIPDASRSGELAGVSFLQGDCMLRTMPADTSDALSAARVMQQLQQACAMFDGYLASRHTKPISLDAALRVGYCRQRIAELIAEPEEKRQELAMARRTYHEVTAVFPEHPLTPMLFLEAARCSARLGNYANAAAELERFRVAPMKDVPIAPTGADPPGRCAAADRQGRSGRGDPHRSAAQYEPALLKDPARVDYVPTLQYCLALALKESGQFEPARKLFKSIAANYPRRPEAAEASWRLGQCAKEQATRELDAAKQKLAAATTPELQAAARAAIDSAAAPLRLAADALSTQAAAVAAQSPNSQTALLMYYDAAWAWRTLAPVEIETARAAMQAKATRDFKRRLAADGSPAANAIGAEVPLASVPIQPAEQQARVAYRAIIQLAADSPIAIDARLELSDLHLQRDEHEAAAAALKDLLANDPPQDLADRVRLRLGTASLARGDYKSAYEAFQAVVAGASPQYLLFGREGAAEAKFLQKDYAGVIQVLSPLIEGQPPRVIVGARDRAILRLAQAYCQLGQWPSARAVLEVFVARFPASPLAPEARCALGLACENLKDYDAAIAAYSDVPRSTSSELAAQSLYQAGLCRMQQKRPQDALNLLLSVAYTYDYPDWTAAALCEAAGAMIELNRPADAIKLLDRVARGQPASRWGQLAAKRLTELKPK